MHKVLPVDPNGQGIPLDHQKIIAGLADEGVPMRAIARATKHPSDEVRAVVRFAFQNGLIVAVPPEDWPVGEARDKHASTVTFKKLRDDDLATLCKRMFKIPPLQAAVLAVLLRRDQVTRDTLHGVVEQRRKVNKQETDPKIVDVIICNMRKALAEFDIGITTIWSFGYCIEPETRKRANTMLEEFMASLHVPAVMVGEDNGR